ncbi:MAG TPA: elongation factor P [Candidatus Saccharimonadales bacterium]|nr:elongation factor P [Candidatus Saccharimonadales bacterium]
MYGHTDLRKDILIELDGAPYRVVEYSHSAMGRGGAVVRTKLKNLLTGAVIERSFRTADKVAPAQLEREEMQYLYRDGDNAVLMNQSTYDQKLVSFDTLGEQSRFMAENTPVTLLGYKGKVIGMEMPNSVNLKVTQTEPGARGDTATAALKPCTVETGASINVPLFINEGDVIKVDTRTGQYLARAAGA